VSRKKAAPAPAVEIDPGVVWQRIDTLVRSVLPARVEALSFAPAAAALRSLSDLAVVCPATMRAASRDIRLALFEDYLVTHWAAVALRGGDELEYQRARRADDERGERMIRASQMIGYALEVIPGWAVEGHGLTFERRLEIASGMLDEALEPPEARRRAETGVERIAAEAARDAVRIARNHHTPRLR
jgi:hypothetical protein